MSLFCWPRRAEPARVCPGRRDRRDFGSLDRWRTSFLAMGKAQGGGSGWVYPDLQPRDKRLSMPGLRSHHDGGGEPILVWTSTTRLSDGFRCQSRRLRDHGNERDQLVECGSALRASQPGLITTITARLRARKQRLVVVGAVAQCQPDALRRRRALGRMTERSGS